MSASTQRSSTLPVVAIDLTQSPPPINLWHLLSTLSSIATFGFASLSMAGVGINNRYAVGLEVQSAVTPTYYMLFVWGAEQSLSALWAIRLAVAGRTDIANLALPYFVAKCIFISAWIACSIVKGTTGLIAELLCLFLVLACCVVVYAKQRTFLTYRKGLNLVADVSASVSLVVWTFCVGVAAVVLVVHTQETLPVPSVSIPPVPIPAHASVLSNDIQLSIPNLLTGMVSLILVVYSRDMVASLAAIACVITYNEITLIIVAGTIHIVLFLYAIVRRSKLCT